MTDAEIAPNNDLPNSGQNSHKLQPSDTKVTASPTNPTAQAISSDPVGLSAVESHSQVSDVLPATADESQTDFNDNSQTSSRKSKKKKKSKTRDQDVDIVLSPNEKNYHSLENSSRESPKKKKKKNSKHRDRIESLGMDSTCELSTLDHTIDMDDTIANESISSGKKKKKKHRASLDQS